MPLIRFFIKWIRIYWFRLLKQICLHSERDKHVWVFGARDRRRYDENTKYLFEYVSNHIPDIQAVWLTRDPAIRDHLLNQGFDARMSHSLSGYWAQFKAGITFINVSYRDVNWFLMYGCPVVQLWHGTPMMHNDIKYLYEEYAFVTLASEEFLGPQQLGPPELFDFRLTGYPRADSLYRSDDAPCIQELKERYGYEKLVLYVPTHRRPPQWDGKHNPKVKYGLFAAYDFDFDACEALMKKHNALFVMKLHPLQPFSDAASAERFEASQHMHLVNPDSVFADAFEYMRGTDILVTDYSSILFDYLLLDRPAIFTPFDMEYILTIRDFRFSYDAITPGPKVSDWPGAMKALERTLEGEDGYAEQRDAVCRQFNYYRDDGSCARVAREAKEYLGLPV